MANELTVSANMNFTKGPTNVSFNQSGLQFNVTGTKSLMNVQTIGTSATALNVGDLVSIDSSGPGWILIQNTDPTNYVTFRAGSTGADLIKLLPGEFWMGRLATTTPYALANTAAVVVQYLMIEI